MSFLAALSLAFSLPAAAYQGDVDVLRQGLEDGAWNERIRAVNQLAAVPDKEASTILAKALRDPDWQVRLSAAHGLGKRGRESKPLLEARLAAETCPLVRMTLAHWLAGMGQEPRQEPRKTERLQDCESWFWPVSPEYLKGRGRTSQTEVATPPDANGCVYVRFSRAGRTSCPAGTVVKGVGQAPGSVDFLKDASPMSGVALCCPAGKESGSGVGEAAAPQDTECRLVPMECPTGWLEMQPEEEKGLFSKKDPRYQRSQRMKEGDLPWVNCCRGMQPSKPPEPAPSRPTWEAPTTGSRIAGLAFLEDASEEEADLEDEPPPSPEPPARSRRGTMAPGTRKVQVVRSRAPEAQGGQGGSATLETPAPLDALLASLRSKDPEERSRAALGLGSLGRAGDPAVSPLISALKDQNPGVRACAAMALGNITRGSDRAVAFIRALLSDRHSGVRYSAAQSLGRIGTSSAQKAFSDAMRKDAESLIKSGQ